MEVAELRRSLAAFLGDAQFRKFVKQGFLRGKLRFWQERDWNRLTTANPQFAISMEGLEVAIRICELHGDELLPDTASVYHGCVDYAQWYVDAVISLFPHAASDPVSTEGRPFDGASVGVLYCPACRRAKSEWERRSRRNRPT